MRTRNWPPPQAGVEIGATPDRCYRWGHLSLAVSDRRARRIHDLEIWLADQSETQLAMNADRPEAQVLASLDKEPDEWLAVRVLGRARDRGNALEPVKIEVFREYGARQVGRWGGHFRWFNDHDVETLERAFVGFSRLWANAVWREPLKKLIYLYVNANAGPPDLGLVLAHAALEQMAWHLLVNDRKVLSAEGFDKLAAADRLRLLVSTCGIPLDTPSSLQDLAAMRTQGRQVTDGPDRIARLRNDFVHPPRGGASARTHGRIVDAWRLSIWYLELALLSMMGQSGTYRSRLTYGEISSLPWS